MNKNRRIKNILLITIGVLLLIFGIVVGLLAGRMLSEEDVNETGAPEMAVEESGKIKASEPEREIAENGSIKIKETESGTHQSESFESGGTETKAETKSENRLPESTPGLTGAPEDTAAETSASATATTQASISPVRIVLDPGHDDSCSRNHPDLGFNEQDLNLKIAQACRDELETYAGVEVYLTREDGSCPDNGIGSGDVSGRTAYAQSVGADLFVSLHNNATGLGYPSDANGAEVYISVHSAFSDESRKLGEAILKELTSQVDLADRGVLTRVKPEKGCYDNGQVKDWYYLISTSVERGFPGIIVEHAFMDNPHDNAILKDDEQLKAMGIADATGIAAYFGLERISK